MGTRISLNNLRKLIREEVEKQTNEAQTLSKEKKKSSAGLPKKEKSSVTKKDKVVKGVNNEEKAFNEIEKNAKESGATDPKAVAGTVMLKNTKK